MLEALSANSQVSEKAIRDTFDGIAEKMRARRDVLLQRLWEIADTKRQQLEAQQSGFEEKVKTLDVARTEAVSLMKDTESDPAKRKIKIMRLTQEAIGADQFPLNPATNDRLVVNLAADAINAAITRFGAVLDGVGALPPTVSIRDVLYDAVKVVVKPHDDEKECVAHKLKYIASKDVDDEKAEWKALDVDGNGDEAVECEIRSLQKATKYVVRAASKNKAGFGAYSERVSFETADRIDIAGMLTPQMVFDSFNIDPQRMQIMNDREIQCKVSYNNSDGASIRLKCAMPTPNNSVQHITSIYWQVVVHTSDLPDALFAENLVDV